MAKIFEFTALDLFNTLTILDPDSEALVYTPLGLNVTARRFDASGNATSELADTDELLIGYNTTAVPPLSLGALSVDILVKNGDSTSDSLRATSGNDIVYWDYATLFSLTSLSVPVGVAVVSRYNLPSASQDAAIEVFDLGSGDDILNLTHYNGQFLVSGLLTDPMAYGFSATAYGGDGHDVLWTGNQDDRVFGDGGDDTVDGGGGNDTLFGGTGMDTLAGGPGDDFIFDAENAVLVRGGGGSDVIALQLNNPALALSPSSADDGDLTDGNDRVIIGGDYASSSFSLGGGDDTFIALSSTAASADSIAGGTGSDVMATWTGDDRLAGEDGNDVLWGGAGGDTIYGGPGDDLLYNDSGVDIVFGGAGRDLLYLGRADGAGNQFYDLEREGLAPDGNDNAIMVFGLWTNEPTGDGLDDTQGVYELDGSIMDNDGDDMVYVSQVSGNIYRLEVVGGGTTGASVEFDVRDVDYIILWDNAGVSGQYQQQYQWDAEAEAYVRIM